MPFILPTRAPVRRVSVALVLVAALSGCARRAAAPEPGEPQATPPDLRGARVMVFPVQQLTPLPGDMDAELAFALRERTEAVSWILPSRLQEALDRSPGLDARIHGLAVGTFSAGEVRRVGDPLYGDLRRIGALTDAEVALIPVRAWVHQAEDGARVRVTVTLIQVRTGRVLWFGVAEGDARDPTDPGAVASAAEAMARTLLWYVPGTGATTSGA